MLSNRSYYYPLWIIVPYILIGLFSSIWGAFEYQEYNQSAVLTYILSFLILFGIGFSLGTNLDIPTSSLFGMEERKKIVVKLFKLVCVISVLFMSFELATMILSRGISLNINTMGEAYIQSYEGHERNSGNYSLRFLISSIAALPMFITVVWGVFYYNKLSLVWRVSIIYVIIATVLVYTIGVGKQKQLGDLVVYFVAIWGIRQVSMGKIYVRNVLKIGSLVLFGIILMLGLLGSRYAAIGVNSDTINANIHELIYFKQDSYIMQIFGQNLGFAISMLSGYLGQGYYGLSLALEQDFTWTAFGGSSYSISVILNQLFGLPFMVEQSYPYLVADNTGWAETKWHSIFSWLASDLTFPGTLFLLAGVAFIYGRAWKEAILVGNPFSILLFCLLSVGIIYIPANNQLMHSPGGLFTLMGAMVLYYLFHASFNVVQDPVEADLDK